MSQMNGKKNGFDVGLGERDNNQSSCGFWI